MKKITSMTADEVRDLLFSEYNWDVEKMALDNGLTIHEVTVLLQCGGDNAEKKAEAVRATFDVAFNPMTSIELFVADPHNLTEDEIRRIVDLAAINMKTYAGEKFSTENLQFIRTYSVDGKEEKKPMLVFGNTHDIGIDPEILFELAIIAYKDMYALNNDHAEVRESIFDRAAELTERYKNTDWDSNDFWETMEKDADILVDEWKKSYIK